MEQEIEEYKEPEKWIKMDIRINKLREIKLNRNKIMMEINS